MLTAPFFVFHTMAQLSVDIPHALGQDEAARRFKERFAAARSKYGDQISELREQWQDHTLSFAFRVMGWAISGKLAVEADSVRLRASLPAAIILFKSMIEKRVREEVGELLAVSPGSAG
jgi:hypothetical protein